MAGTRTFRVRALAALAALAGLCGLLAAAAPGDAKPAPTDRQNRILGGGPAAIENFPYMAGIFNRGRFICTGSVISPRHVLTAAHCNVGPAADFQVVTGRTNLADTATGQAIPAVQTFTSPDYAETERGPRGHDLAVIALAAETTAPPLAVATEAEGAAATLPGSPLTVAGWGATNKKQKAVSTGQLKVTSIAAVANKRCKRYRKAFKAPTMICTSGPKVRPGSKRSFRTSACAGDSGAPLQASTPAGLRIVGTVSYGPRACGLPFLPVVYAKAFDTYARNFIASAVFTPLPPPG